MFLVSVTLPGTVVVSSAFVRPETSGCLGDCKCPECENLQMVSVYSAGASTAGGTAIDGENIGRSHAVIAIDFLCLPKTLKNASGRRETCFENTRREFSEQ